MKCKKGTSLHQIFVWPFTAANLLVDALDLERDVEGGAFVSLEPFILLNPIIHLLLIPGMFSKCITKSMDLKNKMHLFCTTNIF